MKHLGCGRCSSRRLQHPRRYRAPRVRSSCNRYRSAFCLREGILYNIRESRDQAVAMRNGPSRKADPGQTRVSRGTFFSPVNLKTMNITKSVLNPRRTKTSPKFPIIGQVSNLTQIDATLKRQLLNADSYVKKNINASNYLEFQPLLKECLVIVKLILDSRPVKQQNTTRGGSQITVDIVKNINTNTNLSIDEKVNKLLEYVMPKPNSILRNVIFGTCWFAVSIISTCVLYLPPYHYGDTNPLLNANNGPKSPEYRCVYNFTRLSHEIERRNMGTNDFVKSKLNFTRINDNYVNIMSWLVWSKTIEKASHYIIIIRYFAGFDEPNNSQEVPYFIKHQIDEINKREVSREKAELRVVAEYYHRLFYFKGYPLSNNGIVPTPYTLSVFYLYAIEIQHRFAAIQIQSPLHQIMLDFLGNPYKSMDNKLDFLTSKTQSIYINHPETRTILLDQSIPTYLNLHFNTNKHTSNVIQFTLRDRTIRGVDISREIQQILKKNKYTPETHISSVVIQDIDAPDVEQKITDAVYHATKDYPMMVKYIMLNFKFIITNIRSDLPTNRITLTPIERIERIDQPRPPQRDPSNTQPPRPPPSNTQPRPPPSNNWDVANAAGTTMGAISSCAIMGGAGGKRARVAHTGPNGGKYYLDEKTGKKTYIRQNKKVSRKKKTVR
jgi:hypothetical protein